MFSHRRSGLRRHRTIAAPALKCAHNEYPNKIGLVYNNDAEVTPPRLRAPAFYGCFDWHSTVHGHWLLARLLRLHPDAPYAAVIRAALDQSLTPENIAGEVRALSTPNQASYERPCGLAWLLALDSELEKNTTPDGKKWASAVAPLSTARTHADASLPFITGEHCEGGHSAPLRSIISSSAADERRGTATERQSPPHCVEPARGGPRC